MWGFLLALIRLEAILGLYLYFVKYDMNYFESLYLHWLPVGILSNSYECNFENLCPFIVIFNSYNIVFIEATVRNLQDCTASITRLNPMLCSRWNNDIVAFFKRRLFVLNLYGRRPLNYFPKLLSFMMVLKAQSGTRLYVEQFYRTLFILIEFFKGSPWSFF